MVGACAVTLILRKQTNLFSWHSSSRRCITLTSFLLKYHRGKHSLTFWTFSVTLTLNSWFNFFHRALRLMMLYYQAKFGCKWANNLEDKSETAIFWLYKPLLWPWPWKKWMSLTCLTLHLMIWYTTIPSLVKNSWAVQEISSGQNQTHWQHDKETDTVIPIYPPSPRRGGGGIKT